ncbi:hypothetical protein ElyMa_004650900 [Elysia marginata]|uniref:Uncharacterized protein n=1 Tax=Elysia marginata TaxID=1093978 RepID=A0AAV4I2N8_9GAST|nr:hypothetical protein ElyMa_004650900 [Elysia marginata]
MNTAQLKLSGNMQKGAKAFNQAIIDAAKVSIPRGYRKNYKPYWTPALEKLHKDLGLLKDKLIQEPSDANTIAYNRAQAIFKREKLRQCRKNWQKTTDSLNMDKEGKKLWRLTQALNDDNPKRDNNTAIICNGVAKSGKRAADVLAKQYKSISTIEIDANRVQEVKEKIKEIKKPALHIDVMEERITPKNLERISKV